MITNVRPSHPKFVTTSVTEPSPTDRVIVPSNGAYGITEVTMPPLRVVEGEASPQSDTKTYYPSEQNAYGFSKFTVHPYTLQDNKSVIIDESTHAIRPDSGYYAIKSVTVQPNKLQTGKTLSLKETSQSVTPDSGYYGFDKVTVYGAKLQNITVPSITSSAQVFKPSSGYYGIGKITVPTASNLKTIIFPNYRNPGSIENTVGLTSIKSIAIQRSSDFSIDVDGIASFYGSTLSGRVNVISGFSDNPFQNVFNFNDVVTINSSEINIDVPGLNWYRGGDTFSIFIIGE